jgi:hypothetical protein
VYAQFCFEKQHGGAWQVNEVRHWSMRLVKKKNSLPWISVCSFSDYLLIVKDFFRFSLSVWFTKLMKLW